MARNEISNSDDVIDSRDVIARIEELETDIAGYEVPSGSEYDDAVEELAALRALADEADGCADWEHGEALIRDSYFRRYAQGVAEDCCDMSSANSWPFTCLDWDKAARELQMDYTSVEFDGVTYWIRS